VRGIEAQQGTQDGGTTVLTSDEHTEFLNLICCEFEHAAKGPYKLLNVPKTVNIAVLKMLFHATLNMRLTKSRTKPTLADLYTDSLQS
jgi:hypothetical protein